MSRIRTALAGLLACWACLAVAVEPTAEAGGILQKIRDAAKTLNYDGIFVYQHGSQVQTFRIVHRYDQGEEWERVEVLDNVQREFIRHNNKVTSLLPDKQLVIVESTRKVRFPALLFAEEDMLLKYYDVFQSPEPGRVAGRPCTKVDFLPKDGLRPAFRLCADKTTWLLLMAQVVDDRDSINQQIVFTQVQIEQNIPESEVMPSWDTRQWQVIKREPRPIDFKELGWKYTLPDGYRISMQERRTFKDGREVDQMMLTDGLASMSIFIEPYQQKLSQHQSTGLRQIGSVNLYGKRVGDYWVVVVGEVPVATIQLVADSLSKATDH